MNETPEINSNRKLWDNFASVHVNSPFYDVPGFLKGKSSLSALELGLLGDVRGKSILHLQCHFGLGTLSMSRLGGSVTGVDFSEVAIKTARELNDQLGLNAKFVLSEVTQLENSLDAEFDIVLASFGIIGWHSDLKKWAQIVSRFLKRGGKLCFAEFHPVRWMLSDDFSRIQYSYFNRGVIVEENAKSYAEREAGHLGTAYGWNHSLGELFEALEGEGLTVTNFREYDYSVSGGLQNAIEIDGRYYVKGLEHMLPLMYSLIATK
jgi:SAM-dependent methyltransferase